MGSVSTDLHVVDGEVADIKYPIVPGHEIVGRVDGIGRDVTMHRVGDRVGVPWLGIHLRRLPLLQGGDGKPLRPPALYRIHARRRLATHTIADARYAFPLGEDGDDVSIAPLLCAGLIGWRSLVMAGNAERLGIYGFGAAGHIVAQVARWQGRSVYAFTRSGDHRGAGFCPPARRGLGREVGAVARHAAGCRDHLCPRRRIGTGWRCARCARAAGWYAREST